MKINTNGGKALLFAAALAVSVPGGAEEINWVGCSISKLGFMQELATAYEKETGIKINLGGGGATKGIRQVASGEVDLGGSCRMPLILRNTDGSYSVESSEQQVLMIPVAWDALVVLTHPDNPVESITREQLQQVLTGEISDWKQLGGEAQPIKLYDTRSKISGVGRTLRQQLFGDADKEFSKAATLVATSGEVERSVEQDRYGLGVSGVSSARQRKVKILKLEGVQPTMETLRSGDYMLYRILFLVAPRDYRSRPAEKGFVDFALSVKGQRTIEQAGTLAYRHGMALLSKAATSEYLHSLDVIEQSGIYSPSGR